MAWKTRMRSKYRVQLSANPERYQPGSKYPGKYCSKPVAEMTAEEHTQHKIYAKAKNKWVRENRSERQKAIVNANHKAQKQHDYTVLADWYVKEILRTSLKCKKVFIPQKVVELKRQQIKLWRLAHG